LQEHGYICNPIQFRIEKSSSGIVFLLDEVDRRIFNSSFIYQCGERWFYTPNNPYHGVIYKTRNQVIEWMKSDCWLRGLNKFTHWGEREVAASADMFCLKRDGIPPCVRIKKVQNNWTTDLNISLWHMTNKYIQLREKSPNTTYFSSMRPYEIWPNFVKKLIPENCPNHHRCCKLKSI